jgi:hypothetical protein
LEVARVEQWHTQGLNNNISDELLLSGRNPPNYSLWWSILFYLSLRITKLYNKF